MTVIRSTIEIKRQIRIWTHLLAQNHKRPHYQQKSLNFPKAQIKQLNLNQIKYYNAI